VELLVGLDYSNLMPEHVEVSSRFTSKLQIMNTVFGNQYILVGEGAPKVTWYEEMEDSERSGSEAANGKGGRNAEGLWSRSGRKP
jgi:hypothetical protein